MSCLPAFFRTDLEGVGEGVGKTVFLDQGDVSFPGHQLFPIGRSRGNVDGLKEKLNHARRRAGGFSLSIFLNIPRVFDV